MSRKPELPRYSAGKLLKPIWKNRFSFFKYSEKNGFSDPEKPEKSISVLKVFGKIDFHYSGEVTHPSSSLCVVSDLHRTRLKSVCLASCGA